MLRVHNHIGLGLVLTGLVTWFVGTTPALYGPIFGAPLKWVAMLSPLAFVLFFSFRIHAMSAATAQALYWTFCAVMGMSLSSVFLVFTGVSIAGAFFIAAIMFGAMSLYRYTTRSGVSRLGSFLMMGLIGIVIARLVNLVLGSNTIQFVVSVIGIVVFTGLTAWDTRPIQEQYADHFGTEAERKLAMLGALSLHLNVVNLFQLLLNVTGQPEE